MFPRGHAGFSLLLNIPFLYYYSNNIIVCSLCIIIIMWTSIFPDIDFSNKLFMKRFDHRGITHTIEFIILFSLIFNCILFSLIYILDIDSFIHTYIFISPIVGISSHIIGDIMDKYGVDISYFMSDKRYCLNLINDNSSSLLNNSLFVIGYTSNIIILFVI